MGPVRSTWGTLENIKTEQLIIFNHNTLGHSLVLQGNRRLGVSLGFLLPCTCRGRYDLHSSRHLQGVVKWGHSGMNSDMALAVCSIAEPSCTRVYLWDRLNRTPHCCNCSYPWKACLAHLQENLDSRVEMPLPTAHSPKSEYQIIHLPLKGRHQSVCVWALQIDKH